LDLSVKKKSKLSASEMLKSEEGKDEEHFGAVA